MEFFLTLELDLGEVLSLPDVKLKNDASGQSFGRWVQMAGMFCQLPFSMQYRK